jgi:hypothetical protein
MRRVVEETGAASAIRRRSAWAFAVFLSAANLLLHHQISIFCDVLYRRLGRSAYEWVTLIGIGGVTLLAAAPVLRRRVRLRAEPRALPALLILAVAGVGAQESLLVTNVELIHFPQFALLAGLLLAGGAGPEAAWLLATAAGIVDELYQYLFIYAEVPNVYLDYNDMVLNALGAAYAVCLFAAAGGRSIGAADTLLLRRPKTSAFTVAGLLAGAAWVDPPRLEPFWRRAMTGRSYHVLSLWEGLLLTLLLWLLVLWLCRKRV